MTEGSKAMITPAGVLLERMRAAEGKAKKTAAKIKKSAGKKKVKKKESE